MAYKENRWYKVFYRFYSEVDQDWHITFAYAMGKDQIKRTEEFYKAEGTYIKTIEWVI